LKVLKQIDVAVKWMSFEPLSWDVADILHWYSPVLDWAVIGAATSGAKAYQPEPEHVEWLLMELDKWRVPIFMKGNLEWEPWREEFPNGDRRS
jgi:protein gp37